MNLASVMEEVADVLSQITGINVFAYPPSTITASAGYVSYPQQGVFDQTYGRGVDRIEGLPITLVAGKASDIGARDRVAAWSAGAGPSSVKEHTEAHAWISCDDLTVATYTFDVEEIAGVPYLEVVFLANVTGPGK